MSRSYPSKDVKILWGLAAGRCAFPDCHALCIGEATQHDPAVTIGEIGHIYSHSDDGPRANPNLTLEERDCYENWILLCGHHHNLVDRQENSYTATQLIDWKNNHEQWVRDTLSIEMPEITFAELEVVTRGLIALTGSTSDNFNVTGISEKMAINKLTSKVYFLLTLGVAKANEVEQFVSHIGKMDSTFPDRLKQGFVNEYNRLRTDGYEGDSLFEILQEFAGGKSPDFRRMAAGLAVLSYLFQKCEVFES